MAEHRAAVRELGVPCCLCGWPINLELPDTHPMSFTVEHHIPRSVAPWLAEERGNTAPAHRRCNSRRGARDVPPPRTSRDW